MLQRNNCPWPAFRHMADAFQVLKVVACVNQILKIPSLC